MNTPILFLVFNRPETTYQVFDVIRKVKPSKLYFAADGPRDMVEKKLCDEVKSIINSVDWPCELKLLIRDKNLGCRIAISEALEWFFKYEEYGIILEDDCVPNTTFFSFCDVLLEKYRYDERITMISGSNHLFDPKYSKIDSYFFSNYCNIWGWATWRRVIEKVNWFPAFSDINMPVDKFTSYIGFDLTFPRDVRNLLFQVIEGKYNTWDTVLFYNLFLLGGINIFPTKNLVSNIGINGTHAQGNSDDITLFRETSHINIDSLFSFCAEYDTRTDVNKEMLLTIDSIISPKPPLLQSVKQLIKRVLLFYK